MFRVVSWIAAVFTATVALLSGEHLQPSSAFAQSIPNPSCAKAGNDFVCVGALDGTSIQQIIVGNFNVPQGTGSNFGTPGYVVIIENTGAVRKRICMINACPTITVQ